MVDFSDKPVSAKEEKNHKFILPAQTSQNSIALSLSGVLTNFQELILVHYYVIWNYLHRPKEENSIYCNKSPNFPKTLGQRQNQQYS